MPTTRPCKVLALPLPSVLYTGWWNVLVQCQEIVCAVQHCNWNNKMFCWTPKTVWEWKFNYYSFINAVVSLLSRMISMHYPTFLLVLVVCRKTNCISGLLLHIKVSHQASLLLGGLQINIFLIVRSNNVWPLFQMVINHKLAFFFQAKPTLSNTEITGNVSTSVKFPTVYHGHLQGNLFLPISPITVWEPIVFIPTACALLTPCGDDIEGASPKWTISCPQRCCPRMTRLQNGRRDDGARLCRTNEDGCLASWARGSDRRP